MCDINITTSRLRDLINSSGNTREFIAKDLGCDTSTVTKHYNGDRKITVDYIIKYANYFNVSSDYLLGLTDTPTTDKDIQFIGDYTGLDKESIEYLNGSITRFTHNLLDFLISGKGKNDFFDICVFFEDYKTAYKKLIEHKEDIIDSCVSLPIDGKQADNIVKLSDELNDKKDLLEFKIQKALTNILRHYCEEEFKKDMQIKNDYQKLYEYLKYENDFELYEKDPEVMDTISRLTVKITNELINGTGDE